MRIFTIIIFLILFSCKEHSSEEIYPKEKNLTENINITLPKFSRWKECYEYETVKNEFNKHKNSGTTIIGAYLDNETAKQKNNIEELIYENYCLFFTRDHEQKWKMNNHNLKKIFDFQIKKSANISFDKKEVLEKISSNKNYLSSKKPVLIEEYTPFENVHSGILLIKPIENNHETIIVYAFNLINIKNHLIYSSYYSDLNGLESITRTKANNDLIISEFVKKN